MSLMKLIGCQLWVVSAC